MNAISHRLTKRNSSHNLPDHIYCGVDLAIGKESRTVFAKKNGNVIHLIGVPDFVYEPDPVIIRIAQRSPGYPVRQTTPSPEAMLDLPGAPQGVSVPVTPKAPPTPRPWDYGTVYAPGEQPRRLKRIPVDPRIWQELGVPEFAPEKLTLRQKIALAARHLFLIKLSYVKAYKTNSGEEGMLKSYVLEP